MYRRRLTVQGWFHVPGIDCNGIFAPVRRFQRTRMMLAIAVELDYEVLMLLTGAQTKFLNADMEEDVFM